MSMPKKYDPTSIEEHWGKSWIDSLIYAWDPSRGREETFAVDTPPPTVSGSLHVGHLFSYSHQDFIVRFQRMCGKNIFFPIGWDDNGLPTERRVQNLFNVKCEAHIHYDPDFKAERMAKGAPTPISRKNFIELCELVTKEDETAFRHLWSRLGLSYDWSLEYATIDEHCRRTSQASFLDMLKKDEVYQDNRPVLWDIDFHTAIAQAEVVDKEVPGAYHFLRFPIRGSEEYLVIATTRPELLPACVAVMVHPDDERFVAYADKEAITPLFGVPVPIIKDNRADPEKGTGVVMVCTFGDQTDVEWWLQYKLPLRQILGEDGKLLPLQFSNDAHEDAALFSVDPDQANTVYEQLAGLPTKKAQEKIVEIAEAASGVIDRSRQEIEHAVKFFEKGYRPLELLPTRQWYGKILDKKEALQEQGKKIEWHPAFMSKRYEHWVDGLNLDWCLSRQRFFGVPIPLWYKLDEHGNCLYDQIIVPDPDSLPVDPLDEAPAGYDESQRGQANGFMGDPDVFDTWATSSLTPQIASRWVDDPERHERVFPMDIRPQSHEIIRTWAFYTIVKAYLHERKIPWRNVVISGWILDPDRKKMSKSQGNVVTPEPLIDQYGADSVRYRAARARLGVDTAYDEQIFKVGKKLCTKLFNAAKFVIGRYEGIDKNLLAPENITTPLDRAVIQEMRPVITRATQAFEAFDYAQALSIVEDFFWPIFCDNYLEMAKPRTYDEALTPERISACAALRLLLRAQVRMFAPFVPYISEEIWHWDFAEDADMNASIHLSPWPKVEEFAHVAQETETMVWDAALKIVEQVRRAKADANLSMAAPIQRVSIAGASSWKKAVEAVEADIKRCLRIETLDFVEDAALTAEIEISAFFE